MTLKPPFEELISRYGQTVLRVCRALLGSVDADDAWSDTFLAALEAYPRLSADANVEAWLVTIAHRKAIDVLRRAGRRAIPVADVPDQIAGEGADHQRLDLAPLMAELPERQRLTVVYHYLAGLPYREVAAIVGGSADAARRAAADGIRSLQRSKGSLR